MTRLDLMGCALGVFALQASAEQVVISEIMYHPPGPLPEYVEVFNNTSTVFDIARWRLTGGVTYEFPDFSTNQPRATFLKPFESIVLTGDAPEQARQAYRIPESVRLFGPWQGKLKNGDERITLQDKNGVALCTVKYADRGQWSPAADGTGHSLELINPNRSVDDGRNWMASRQPRGTPGQPPLVSKQAGRQDAGNRNGPDGIADLHLNEVHFQTGNRSTVDWVELYNASKETTPLEGFSLAARRDFSDRVPLRGTIASHGFVSWDVHFPVSEREVTLYLVDSAQRVLTSRIFTARKVGDTLQDYPDGAAEWYGSTQSTRNASNSPGRQTAIIINEILFDPPPTVEGTEFVELFNRGATEVDLSDWAFTAGIDFRFPAGTRLAPGAYLVVAGHAARFKEVYGAVPVMGDFRGRLRNRGELVRLEDQGGNLADEVEYKVGGDWPDLAGGSGSSLELLHPFMDNGFSSAWRASDESSKARWKTYACTNTYLQLRSLRRPTDSKELHLYLVNDGHVALRNIGLWKGGRNYIVNGTKTAEDGKSAAGWLAQGTHWASHITNGQLQIISDGRGDNRANRVEIDLPEIQRGDTYELRFEARWVSGNPRLIAQMWDHSFAGSFFIEVPRNLGTPGARNSVTRPDWKLAAAHAPPQTDALQHAPAVPRMTNAVRITTHVFSAAPLASVRLFFRPDNAEGTGPWTNQSMFDDGAHGGDAQPGDGIYTAELPPFRTSGQIVQFYVQAMAVNGQASLLPRQGPARPALFMVDDRMLPRDLRVDRFILSEHDLGAIADGNSPAYSFRFPRLSNHYFNMTYIANEEEIFYGGGIRTSGSPWTRGGDLNKGKWKLPQDRPFRSHTRFSYDNDRLYHNRVARYLLYLLGHPVSENEWVRVVFNDWGPDLREDTEPIGNEFLDRFFENGSQGDLYRIDDEWWFADDWKRMNRDADWSYKGSDDPGRYRSEWMKRTREAEDDYGALIAFFKLFSTGQYTQEEIERYLDPEPILKMAAVRGYLADWDSFTMRRGKNGYFYRRPKDGRFQFLHWDSDLALHDANAPFYGERVAPWLEKPYNLSRFHGYLAELAQKYTKDSIRMRTWLQLEEEANVAYTPNVPVYENWFRDREPAVLRELGRTRLQSNAVPSAPLGRAGR